LTTTTTDIRQELLLILKRHRGEANAITGRELATKFGHNNDRGIRLIIRDLIASGLPIASSTGSPKGYFIVETQQEALDYMGELRNRLIENAIRRRDFKRAYSQYLQREVQGRIF